MPERRRKAHIVDADICDAFFYSPSPASCMPVPSENRGTEALVDGSEALVDCSSELFYDVLSSHLSIFRESYTC